MKPSPTRNRILIVEDDEISAAFISNECTRHGFETAICSEAAQIWGMLGGGVAAVLLDLGLPDQDGLEVLREILRRQPKLPCFVITADETASSAVEALKSGAIDYFTKPVQGERLMESLKHAVATASGPGQPPAADPGSPWKSGGMRMLQRLIEKAGKGAFPVLVAGERGSGKPEVASAIHSRSNRSSKPFVIYKVPNGPPQQIEAELFGSDSLSEVEAPSRRRGKMEAASKGSLFIDDVDRLPSAIQHRILEVMKTGVYTRMGSGVRRQVDFRLIFGWSDELGEAEVPPAIDPEFFYGISSMTLRVPAVRNRREDIPRLCEQYITLICIANHCRRPEIAPKAMKQLMQYSWPGNLIELKSVLEHAVSVAEGRMIDLMDLPECVKTAQRPALDSVIRNIGGATISELERLSLVEALEFCNGNRRKVALRLGVSLRTVYNLMERHGIQKSGSSADSHFE